MRTRSTKISKQLRNPFGVKHNSQVQQIMNAYRRACEEAGEYLVYSTAKGGTNRKGGKNLSTTVPEAWLEEMEAWAKEYRGTLGKAFIDACEWWIKGGGVI